MGGRHVVRSKKASSNRSTGDRLRYADEGEMYARCKDKLGSGRFLLRIADGTEVVGKIVGSLYKRAWINKTDLVLLSTRALPGPSGKAYDVVHKYTPDEERMLAKYGELRDWKSSDCDEDDCVEFGDEDANIDFL
jgi:initiation factor 1A